MNLHEYQSKNLLKGYGLPVPNFIVAETVEDAVAACDKLSTDRYVVKAQVHAGGRGKAGGVKVCSTKQEVAEVAESLLGKNLITYQTDSNGQPVNVVMVEETSNIDKELYLGAVIDRSKQRITFIGSTEGGVEIEKVANETPELIHKFSLQPMKGSMPYQGRQMAFKLNLQGQQVNQFVKIINGLSKAFIDNDLSLIEINPLVITAEGDLICLDGKINIDSNAEFRQSDLWKQRDTSQEDQRELEAQQNQLNYVALDGNIGCMVNGAGLAMATMDIIKLHGGQPANFLDVGGGATAQRVTEAFKLILSDSNVKSILINIFGGIVRCDLIAEGIIQAAQQINLTIPLVVRLEGNNAELAGQLLERSGLAIITQNDLAKAAEQVVEAATA